MTLLYAVTGYFIWSGSNSIFSSGSATLRWNTLLLIAGFLVCRKILIRLYQPRQHAKAQISNFAVYICLSAFAGARAGHILLFETQKLWTEPWTLVLPFDTQPVFHLLGREHYSVHGAVLAILIFLYFYSRKSKTNLTLFQFLDRVSVAAILSGLFIFTGSFLNSEIAGKPTTSGTGTILLQPVVAGLEKLSCCIMRSPGGKNPLVNTVVKKDTGAPRENTTHKSVLLFLFFKPGASEQLVTEFLIGDVKAFLFDMTPYVRELGTQPLHYRIILEKDKTYTARVQTEGIARHPVQIYEALSCLILFLVLYVNWQKYSDLTPAGRFFAWGMTAFWLQHLAWGFLKEGQTMPETGLNAFFMLVGIAAVIFMHSKRSSGERATNKR